jgi:hypothetical protein
VIVKIVKHILFFHIFHALDGIFKPLSGFEPESTGWKPAMLDQTTLQRRELRKQDSNLHTSDNESDERPIARHSAMIFETWRPCCTLRTQPPQKKGDNKK